MVPQRILIISRNFPPLVGGMERLVRHAYDQLRQDYGCDLVGPVGCEAIVHEGRAFGCRRHPIPAFLAHAAYRAIKASTTADYSLFLAGSGLTAPITAPLARRAGVPSISFVHGLDLIANSVLYQRFFVPALRRIDLVIANSANTARLAVRRGIPESRICIIHPGVEIPEQIPPPDLFRQHFGFEDRRVILYVGRLVRRKGMAEFIDHAMPEIVRHRPDCVLAIIGDVADDALMRDGNVRSDIHSIINRQALAEHVRMLGRVDEHLLQSAYAAADAFVFPGIEIAGDVEGFGMVAIEAAACGTPTVAFRVGGVPDAVADGQSGRLVAPGDYTGMTEEILGILEDPEPWVERCRAHAQAFAWPRFGKKLRGAVAGLIGTQKRT